MKNLVSVILTTFNGQTRGYLREAVESVLNQTYNNFELLIIDDGSTDKTGDFCNEFLSDVRVKYLFQKNMGLGPARNTGINQSAGDFICFLDDDDVWFPDKLEKQIHFFSNCTDSRIGMVYTSLLLIDGTGNILGHQSNFADGDIYQKLFFQNLVDGPSSVMIKKEVFDKVGSFRDEIKGGDEDNDLWIRIAKVFHIYSISEELVKYRIHPNNMSSKHEMMEFSQLSTFYYNLKDAPEPVQNQKDRIYLNLYSRFAIKHFSLGNFADFRKNYIYATAHGNTSLELKLKFLLSNFPFLIIIMKKLLQKIK